MGIVTPVAQGRAAELERYLRADLPRDEPPTARGPAPAPTSPFTGVLPPTHFARFVVIALDGRAHLLFSSRFDGPEEEYLRALARTPQALTIWGHCHIATRNEALTNAELERHLCDRRHWSQASYVVSPIPDQVTVTEINRALALRSELAEFVAHAERLDPAARAHAFRQLPSVRRLLSAR